MRTTSNYRIYLEKLIISACLQEDAYPEIAGMLTPKNFSSANIKKEVNLNHQKIFEVFEKLYPLKPIDKATVWDELGRTNEIGIILCEYQTHICSTANVKEHAICLVELCIEESFATLLNSFLENKKSSTRLMLTISDFLRTELGHGNVLLSIMRAEEIIGQVDSEALNSIQMFKVLIDRKAFEMKEQIQVDRLFWYLGKLAGNMDINGRLGIEHTRKIVKSITLHGTINMSELTKLLNITI